MSAMAQNEGGGSSGLIEVKSRKKCNASNEPRYSPLHICHIGTHSHATEKECTQCNSITMQKLKIEEMRQQQVSERDRHEMEQRNKSCSMQQMTFPQQTGFQRPPGFQQGFQQPLQYPQPQLLPPSQQHMPLPFAYAQTYPTNQNLHVWQGYPGFTGSMQQMTFPQQTGFQRPPEFQQGFQQPLQYPQPPLLPPIQQHMPLPFAYAQTYPTNQNLYVWQGNPGFT